MSEEDKKEDIEKPEEIIDEIVEDLDEIHEEFAEGRQPSDVKRTVMLSVICWRDQDELERRMNLLRVATFLNLLQCQQRSCLSFYARTWLGFWAHPRVLLNR
jgi:hypothetical protein